MGTSSITITALTATPTLRGNKLKATVLATGPAANLPNLMLKTVVFYASTTNNFATATEIARGNPEALDAGLIEEQTYYYWAKPLNNSDSPGAVYPVSPTAGIACKAIGISGLAFGVANGKLVADTSYTDATVVPNALRVAFKTAAGNDPSVTDPAYLAFPSATLSDGRYNIIAITGPMALTLSPGSCPGGGPGTLRFWIAVFSDSGVPRLALKNCSGGSGLLYPLTETGVDSAVAEGGAGTADERGVFYASQTITAQPFRTIGFLEWTTAPGNAGQWNLVPDIIRLLGASAQLPGSIAQMFRSPFYTTPTTTSIIPLDNSRPLFNEGREIASITFTPKSGCNIIEIDIFIHVSHSVAGAVICAVFQDASGTDEADSVGWAYIPVANGVAQLAVKDWFAAQGATTFKVRIGPAVAGTLTINGVGGSASLGQLVQSMIRISEIVG